MEIYYMVLSYIIIIAIVLLAYFSVTNKVVVKDIVAILSGLTIALGLINYISIEKRNKIEKDIGSKKEYIDNISSTFIKIDSLYLQYPDELRDLFYEFYGFNDFPQTDNPTPITPTNSTPTPPTNSTPTPPTNSTPTPPTNSTPVPPPNSTPVPPPNSTPVPPPNSTPVPNSNQVVIEKREKPIGTRTVISSKEFICINLILEYLSNMYLINPEIFSELKIRQRIACYTQSNKLKHVLSSVKENYSFDFIKALDSQQLITDDELESENINIPYLYQVSKM